MISSLFEFLLFVGIMIAGAVAYAIGMWILNKFSKGNNE